MNIVLFGNGNAAWSFAEALHKVEGINLFISSRNEQKAHEIAEEFRLTAIPIEQIEQVEASLLILAISDSAIVEVSRRFAAFKGLVVHTSGPTPMSDIQCAQRGVLYPLQTMVRGNVTNFLTAPFLLESNSESGLKLLQELASKLSHDVRVLSSVERLALHASAVFVNNFVNHLNAIATSLCDEHQVPFDLLLPLIQKTADTALRRESFTHQTGPAIRKDSKTMEAHLTLLSESEKEIYTLLSKHIQDTHEKKL